MNHERRINNSTANKIALRRGSSHLGVLALKLKPVIITNRCQFRTKVTDKKQIYKA